MIYPEQVERLVREAYATRNRQAIEMVNSYRIGKLTWPAGSQPLAVTGLNKKYIHNIISMLKRRGMRDIVNRTWIRLLTLELRRRDYIIRKNKTEQ